MKSYYVALSDWSLDHHTHITEHARTTTRNASPSFPSTCIRALAMASHRGKRPGAGRPRTKERSWEQRHVRVPIERPLHQSWVELRENGGFRDDSSFAAHLLRVERERQSHLTDRYISAYNVRDVSLFSRVVESSCTTLTVLQYTRDTEISKVVII